MATKSIPVEMSLVGTKKLLDMLRGISSGKLLYKHLRSGQETDMIRYMKKYKIYGFIVENEK